VHRKVMIAALSVSAIFLVSYLTYHFTAPIFVFPGTGWTVPVYYALLISHVILATLATPMVAVTAYRALKGTFDRHKAIARWTIGVWLYVTVTGVMIYVILYHVYPSSEPAVSSNFNPLPLAGEGGPRALAREGEGSYQLVPPSLVIHKA
jgi:putative membrane protein